MTHTTEQLEQMLAAATPGPWTVDAKDPSDVVVWASESELIGNIGHRVQPITVIFDMDEANARLIAAAPTITAELIAARRKLEDVTLERDEAQTDLAKVILSLPTGKGERAAGAVKGVKMMRARLEAELIAAAIAAWEAAQ